MRPAVGDDVVQDEQQRRAPRSPSRSSAARSSGPARQVERARASSRGQAPQPPPRARPRAEAARSTTGSGDRPRRADDLHRAGRRAPAKVVRSASWRRTISSRLAPQRRARRARPREAQRRRACCRPALPGSSWSRNQSRCWAKDRGAASLRPGRSGSAAAFDTGPPGAPRPRGPEPATVGLSKRPQRQLDPERPRAPARRTRVARSEWPPEVELTPARRGPPSRPRPGRSRCTKKGLAAKSICGFGVEVQARRDLAVLQRQHRLDQPGDARRGVEVADVRLHRARSRRARSPRRAERLRQRRDLDRVAERRAGAVRLDVADRAGSTPARACATAMHLGLRRRRSAR